MKFSDGSFMRLYPQTIQDFGLFTEKELSEDEMNRLHQAAGAMSAKMRAVRIVAATNVSKRDLQQRLIQKGEDPLQAKDAVAWMENLHLLDDKATAQSIVNNCIRKGYGLIRAKQALYEKKIPKDLWEEVLGEYPDQKDAIAEYLKSHLKGDTDQRALRRVVDALIRRGHSYSQIRRVLDQMRLDLEAFPEE